MGQDNLDHLFDDHFSWSYVSYAISALDCSMFLDCHLYGCTKDSFSSCSVVHQNSAPKKVEKLAELLLVCSFIIDRLDSFAWAGNGIAYANRIAQTLLSYREENLVQECSSLVAYSGYPGDKRFVQKLTSQNGEIRLVRKHKGFGFFSGSSNYNVISIDPVVKYFAHRRKDDPTYLAQLSILSRNIAKSISNRNLFTNDCWRIPEDEFGSIVKNYACHAYCSGHEEVENTNRFSNAEKAKDVAAENLPLLPEIWRFVAWRAAVDCLYLSVRGVFSDECVDSVINLAQKDVFSMAMAEWLEEEATSSEIMTSISRARQKYHSEIQTVVRAIHAILIDRDLNMRSMSGVDIVKQRNQNIEETMRSLGISIPLRNGFQVMF